MNDFNKSLLNCDTEKSVSAFLDLMYAHGFLPYVTGHTGITLGKKH